MEFSSPIRGVPTYILPAIKIRLLGSEFPTNPVHPFTLRITGITIC